MNISAWQASAQPFTATLGATVTLTTSNVWFDVLPAPARFLPATLVGTYGSAEPIVSVVVTQGGPIVSTNRGAAPADTLDWRVFEGQLQARTNNGGTGIATLTVS